MAVDPFHLPAGFSLTEDDVAKTPPNVLRLLFFLLDENRRLTQRVEHLEERLSRTSRNSNQPPSADSPFSKGKASKGTGGQPGGKRGHPGHRRTFLPPTDVEQIRPTRCACGNGVFPVTAPFYTHQVVELPETLVTVSHFVLHKGKCPRCGKIVKGVLPKEKRTGYGPRLCAAITEMVGSGGDSRRMAQNWCRSVLGIPISLGTIQKIVERTSAAIASHHEAIAAAVRAAPVNHADETVWWEQGKMRWIWTLANDRAAFFLLHPRRSRAAFEELIQKWDGILVSDDYRIYTDRKGLRQSCLSHLIREAQGLSEKNDPVVARFGKSAAEELRRLCRMAHAPPTWGQWSAFYARFIRLLYRSIDRKDAAGKFSDRLLRQIDSLWLFLEKEGVPPTNNHAERCLRFPVLWRKRSFGTRSEAGSRWVERILSLRQTCRIRGIRTFPVLVEAIRSFFTGTVPDLSWIAQAA